MENIANTEVLFEARNIQERIYIIRGEKVMLDRDLAVLYGVPTKALNQAVRRNLERFPEDFMFELSKDEVENLRSQIATSNKPLSLGIKSRKDDSFSRSQFVTLKKQGSNLKYLPIAFTEQGIAMLSSVLNSDRAISVNIQIIRIFTKLRRMIDEYKELRQKIEAMERSTLENKSDIKEIFRIVKLILIQEEKPKEKMGFDTKS